MFAQSFASLTALPVDVNIPGNNLWGVNEVSGSVARNMSGLGESNGNNPKPGTLVTGDPENEIRRSIYRLARRTIDAIGGGTVTWGLRTHPEATD
jgi:hypothetical protein